MNKYMVTIAAACLLASALPAVADNAHNKKAQHGSTMFEEMDANSDGVISKEEFMAAAASRFDKIDANHDGKITHEEVEMHHKAQMDKFNKIREEMKKQEPKAAAPTTSMMPAPTAPPKAGPASTAPGY